jgi:AraC-like DNA-binding protein
MGLTSRIIIAINLKEPIVRQVISANYLGVLEKCLIDCGVTDFLKNLGFDSPSFKEPAAFLSYDQFDFVVKEGYRRSGCPYLGLLFGQHLSIVNHGFLGYAAMTSPNLSAAIKTFLSFLNTRTSLLRGHLHEECPGQAFVEFRLLTNDVTIDRFITEVAVVHLAKMRVFLINASTPCLRMELAFDKPIYEPQYQEILNTQVTFNADLTRVWFLQEELDCPINFADDASYQQAKIQLQCSAGGLGEKTELPERIKVILAKQELHQSSMEQVASKLCLSPRTLRRHLQSYHTTYQELFDEVRLQKAKELLVANVLSITEISFQTGFHDVSSFSKAFKRWTGQTPTDYRQIHTLT